MMSNEEEKRCPLCAEEMDWTDQQFMPCKCGYQICVWCWHHIIDMAEKDETEGRCPACRVIYEKDKIVATQANCKRTMNKTSNKKTKPPKAKPKANEVQKDLTNVRVIQRKMAYVIGLPLNLADEDVLLRKEYFGQYGKVTKVSLSRTAGGAIQQFVNDTCSVYITYSKEEEALRCIQSVHGFVLEGRFLRASFGTAKYCHAWLKNMPCNNSACLYLHSFGADEDSFGKDEVAAVHTRSRVQQIVGTTNNVVKRSGNVLPSPIDDMHNNTNIPTDQATVRSGIPDAVHGSARSTSNINCPLPSKEKEGAIASPHKMTTFVDIVGRSSNPPEKDGNTPEDRRILNISSELSSVAISEDIHAREPYSVATPFKVPSSSCVANGLFKNSLGRPLSKDTSLSNKKESRDVYGSHHRAFSLHSSNPENISEELGGVQVSSHEKTTPSVDCFTADHNPVHNHEDGAYLCQEMKFQNSAKSDRIYRSSKSFSNEEIVEHLRRIDDDVKLTNGGESSVLDAVESSIISNIMSIDFDSCEDSLTMTNGLSELLDENDGLGNSSWSSLNSDQSGYSFIKQDGFASQMAGGSILPDYRDNKEQYLCKPQYPVGRPQSLAPPGFSLPSRDPPPGFSTSERTSCLPRASSVNRLANASSFSNALLQPPSTRLNSSSVDNVDFLDATMLNCGQGNRTNGFKNPSFELRQTGSTPRLNAFEEESRLWLLMQQSATAHQDSKFSQLFAPHQIARSGHMGNGFSGLDDVYGSSSRLADEHQNNGNPSFFTQVSQQKYANGHISNTKGEVGTTDLQRNERLGVNKYFPGYGDLMFSSGDIYTRVFGL